MTLYPTLDQVGAINHRAGGGGLASADVGGVEAALARPESSFAGVEIFPDLLSKAGALLHGLCSTQYFVDGNKRTAWLTAVLFLEANGVELPPVADIESEAFVLAVATIHDFDASKAAEWFQVTSARTRVGYATDPRVEYIALAASATGSDVGGDGTIDVVAMHLRGLAVGQLPTPAQLTLVMSFHWRPEDLGRPHPFELRVAEQTGRRVVAKRGVHWTHEMNTPTPSGHLHHNGVMPALLVQTFEISLISEGTAMLQVLLDGAEVGRIPFAVHHVSGEVPDVIPFA